MPAKLLTTMIFLLALSSIASAEEKYQHDVEQSTRKPLDLSWEGTDQRPSEDFLEFLANWETVDGKWISPLEIKTLDIPENQNEATSK